ncbi:hypothetical protein LPJ73_008568, partial [Coemansia sp. RSA 2703]
MDVTDQNQTQRHDGMSSSHQHDIDSTPSDTSVTTVLATSLDTTTTPATQPTHTTESSHLPVRSSVNRAHSVSSRTSPYPLSHNTSRHALPGEAANIPRTAQYHAVGMPARHPLGVQTDPMHSDVSSADSADGNGIDMEPEVLAALRSTREVVDGSRVESGRVGLVSLAVVSSDDEDEGNDNEEEVRDDQVGAGGSTSAATAFGDDEARRLSQ